jgi:hypothetical protein
MGLKELCRLCLAASAPSKASIAMLTAYNVDGMPGRDFGSKRTQRPQSDGKQVATLLVGFNHSSIVTA